jgi:hypothetical protein
MDIQRAKHDVDRAESPPPDWGLVAFEVSCARCGQDLRGQTDPTCPACKFRFAWSDAVPIEHLSCEQCGYALMGLTTCRCPECGTVFTWKGAIAAYRQSRHELFEFRWRDRPLRSLVRTAYLMFRPKRLWQQLDIHDRPRTGPLLAMSAVALLMILVVLPLFESAFSWAQFRSFNAASPPTGVTGRFAFSRFLERAVTSPNVYMHAVHLLAWVLLTGAILLLLRQSMRRCRILPHQVFRVWAYCVPLPVAMAIVVTTGTANLILITEFRPGHAWDVVWPLVIGLYLTYLLREGYRRYLRMPHAWCVAIAAHLIGFGGSMVVIMHLNMLFYR